MNEAGTPGVVQLAAIARRVADEVLRPEAERIDRECQWPAHAFAALREERLLALVVPRQFGGFGHGLEALAVVTEELGRACASSALCFGMHCVGSAVIAAKATPAQINDYLRPIAAGTHLTTLALSETGSGSHFYLPATRARRVADGFCLDGEKQFVTNGGHADSYVVSVAADGAEGDFSCLVVDRDQAGVTWLDGWHGLGMRGNSSRGMRLTGATVPADRLLGSEGDQIWYVFEVVAPYFLMAMAGTYLGVAAAALDLVIEHGHARVHEHSGEALASHETFQVAVARLWSAIERTRRLIRHAARLGDAGDAAALPAILAAKIEVADTAVHATNEALTLLGGMGYRDHAVAGRLLRDARAAHVMSPTTHMLSLWLGRSVLGQPLL